MAKLEVRKEVLDFRASLSKVVALLTAKKIPVIDSGNQAYCEYDKNGSLVKIVIPSVPSDASDDLLFAIRGFIDHEVGHVLFTDSEIWVKFASLSNSASHILNCLEDVFVERKMGLVFIGSKSNILLMNKFVINKYIKPQLADINIKEISPRELLYNHLFISVCKAYGGHIVSQDLIEPYLECIKPELDILEKINFKTRLNKINSTMGSVRLSADLIKLLELEEPAPSLRERESKAAKASSEDDRKGGSSGIGSSSATTSGGTKGGGRHEKSYETSDVYDGEEPTRAMTHSEYEEMIDEKSKELEEESTDEFGAEHDGSGGEEGKGSEIGGSEDSGTVRGEEESDPETSTGGEEFEDHVGEDELSGSEDEDESPEPSYDKKEPSDDDEKEDGRSLEELKSEFEASSDDLSPEDSSGMLSSLMADEIDSLERAKTYTPYTRVLDFMDLYENAENYLKSVIGYSSSICTYIKDDSLSSYHFDMKTGLSLFKSNIETYFDSANAGLAKELERLISSKNKIQYVPGQRKGKIHSANLYRLSMDDSRVFRKKEEFRAVNASVEIIVDLSGSMHGSKVCTALASSYIISDALDKINVPNVICGFTTHGSITIPDEDRYNYQRFEPLMLPIMKNWGERANTDMVCARLGLCSDQLPLSNNADGESILALSQLIASRTEDKRIVIVLSDGQPACIGDKQCEYLVTVNSYLTQIGIDVFGIGINTDAPKKYYKKSICLNEVKDLGKTLISVISGSIM